MLGPRKRPAEKSIASSGVITVYTHGSLCNSDSTLANSAWLEGVKRLSTVLPLSMVNTTAMGSPPKRCVYRLLLMAMASVLFR